MTVIFAKRLKKEWNGRPLFEQVDLEVLEGERIAIFGRNGCGKTTLLSVLLGRTAADGGTVRISVPEEERGWLEQQQPNAEQGQSLLDFALSGDKRRQSLKRELERFQTELQNGSESGDLEAYGDVLSRYMEANGYEWEADVERTLAQMKLGRELWNLPYADLSGGQKTRAQLARLVAGKPKLLVLDEPTNHLDAETLLWLEEWLIAYRGTVLFVSHDRAFLDRIATAIVELNPDGAKRYPGGYTSYREQKERERRERETLYRKQQQAREALLESIRMYSEWYRIADRDASKQEVGITKSYWKGRATKHTSRLRAKEKELERLEQEAVQKEKAAPQLKMKLKGSEFKAHTLLRLERIGFAYESGQPLIRGLSLAVERGDRLAVLGPNGSGKSTLLKLLIGKLPPSEGEITVNPQTRIGYFSQELEVLQPEETIVGSLLALPGMTQSIARTVLGCFLFSGDDAFRRIGDLSMGEKCRVAFLRLYFSGANLLVLDEPTNYLDIDTRERVEEALGAYHGAIVLVSHDRYLVRCLANRLLLLQGGVRTVAFEGGLAEYEEAQAAKRQGGLPDDPERAAEAAELELKLVRWMAESAESEEEQTALLARIAEAKRRLAQLREQP
jgi:ATPase subunit of ABC transporter with duplicated ATPase domains